MSDGGLDIFNLRNFWYKWGNRNFLQDNPGLDGLGRGGGFGGYHQRFGGLGGSFDYSTVSSRRGGGWPGSALGSCAFEDRHISLPGDRRVSLC